VRVTTRPELKPRARTGYIAAANSIAAVQQGDIREP